MLAGSISALEFLDFSKERVDGVWEEGWKSGKLPAPQIDALTEEQAFKQLTGAWIVILGATREKAGLFLTTNHSVTLSERNNGWGGRKDGQWQIFSDKVAIFIEGENSPRFVFLAGRVPYLFDPGSTTLMSPLTNRIAESNFIDRVYSVNPDIFRAYVAKHKNLKQWQDEEMVRAFGPSSNATAGGIRFGSYRPTRINFQALKELMINAGADFQPPRGVWYNDRTGVILIRATAEEHESICLAIEKLNFEPTSKLPGQGPPQP